jgi:hypothetical protein
MIGCMISDLSCVLCEGRTAIRVQNVEVTSLYESLLESIGNLVLTGS